MFCSHSFNYYQPQLHSIYQVCQALSNLAWTALHSPCCAQETGLDGLLNHPMIRYSKTSWIAPRQEQDPGLGSSYCGKSWDGRASEPPWRIKLASPVGQKEDRSDERSECCCQEGQFLHSALSYCTSPPSHSPAPATPRVGAPHVSPGHLLLWVSPPDHYGLWPTALLSDEQRTFPGCRSEGKDGGLKLKEKRQKEVNNKKRTADHADLAVCKGGGLIYFYCLLRDARLSIAYGTLGKESSY